MNLGYRVYGLAALALGVIGFVWHDFALDWQPVPAGIPNRLLLAFLVAVTEALSGLSLLWRRTALSGALTLAILYALGVVLLQVPQVVAHPLDVGAWGGVADQVALVAGGLAAFATIGGLHDALSLRLDRIAWVLFGLCCLVFGTAHFRYEVTMAATVPNYLPLGQLFWIRFTGAAHMAAGLGILSGVRARLAAQLLTAMFVAFAVLVHAPLLLHSGPGDPHWHLYWVMNAMNLALAGAAWSIADSLKDRGTWT